MTRPIIFSTSTCSWCRRVKRYFHEKGVSFNEFNVERDPGATRDLVRKTGLSGVPVIKIGGAWIAGFDRERIDRELGRRAS